MKTVSELLLFHTTQNKKFQSLSNFQFIKSILRFNSKPLSFTISYLNQYFFLLNNQKIFNYKLHVEIDMIANII